MHVHSTHNDKADFLFFLLQRPLPKFARLPGSDHPARTCGFNLIASLRWRGEGCQQDRLHGTATLRGRDHGDYGTVPSCRGRAAGRSLELEGQWF